MKGLILVYFIGFIYINAGVWSFLKKFPKINANINQYHNIKSVVFKNMNPKSYAFRFYHTEYPADCITITTSRGQTNFIKFNDGFYLFKGEIGNFSNNDVYTNRQLIEKILYQNHEFFLILRSGEKEIFSDGDIVDINNILIHFFLAAKKNNGSINLDDLTGVRFVSLESEFLDSVTLFSKGDLRTIILNHHTIEMYIMALQGQSTKEGFLKLAAVSGFNVRRFDIYDFMRVYKTNFMGSNSKIKDPYQLKDPYQFFLEELKSLRELLPNSTRLTNSNLKLKYDNSYLKTLNLFLRSLQIDTIRNPMNVLGLIKNHIDLTLIRNNGRMDLHSYNSIKSAVNKLLENNPSLRDSFLDLIKLQQKDQMVKIIGPEGTHFKIIKLIDIFN